MLRRWRAYPGIQSMKKSALRSTSLPSPPPSPSGRGRKSQAPSEAESHIARYLAVWLPGLLNFWLFCISAVRARTQPLCLRRGAQALADRDLRLSEHRRCEFEQGPASAEHHRLPRAPRGVADSGVALFFGTFFFGEANKSDCAAGRTFRHPAPDKERALIDVTALTPALSQRERG